MKVGDKYNHWEVIELLPKYKVLCLCLGCGTTKRTMLRSRLKGNYSKSCGCRRVEVRKETNLERYGHEFTSNVPDIQQKIKEHFIEKYGVDNPRKAKEVKSKIKEVKKKKYGENQELVVAKFKKTLKERYGVEGILSVPEIKEKKRNTMLNKYGVEYALQNEEVKLKLQQTNLERYGTDNPLKSRQVREKGLKTLKERYQVDNPSQSDLIKTKWAAMTPTGEFVIDLAKRHNVPYTTANKIFRDYGGETLLEYCEQYQTSLSSLEMKMLALLKTIDSDITFWNKAPKENIGIRCRPDFRLEINKKTVYINADGLYLHSELNKSKEYHSRLRKHFEANNIQLLQFREDEIRDKPDIVKSIILSAVGLLPEKINGRDCIVKLIDSATSKQFLENNHLMGNYIAAKSYGLFYQDELIQVMSVRKVNNMIEISRFCTKINYMVRGGFSKLLKKIIKIYQPNQIASFCDLRYANGRSYDVNDFKRVSVNQSWCWTNGSKTFNRLKCKANMDERGLSEAQHAKELKWYKIYDAGQAKYILTI